MIITLIQVDDSSLLRYKFTMTMIKVQGHTMIEGEGCGCNRRLTLVCHRTCTVIDSAR